MNTAVKIVFFKIDFSRPLYFSTLKNARELVSEARGDETPVERHKQNKKYFLAPRHLAPIVVATLNVFSE